MPDKKNWFHLKQVETVVICHFATVKPTKYKHREPESDPWVVSRLTCSFEENYIKKNSNYYCLALYSDYHKQNL